MCIRDRLKAVRKANAPLTLEQAGDEVAAAADTTGDATEGGSSSNGIAGAKRALEDGNGGGRAGKMSRDAPNQDDEGDYEIV